MEAEQSLKILEDDVKLLKAQIKQALVDLRLYVTRLYARQQ